VGQGSLVAMWLKLFLKTYDCPISLCSEVQGATIRAVVRSHEKGEALKAVFPSYADKIETAVVENNEAPGAYDSVVQEVDIIVHMASPLLGTAGTDNETGYLIPARDGILNMLKSASKSPSVKRVITTSSSTAVVDTKLPRYVP
jgi:nucleoside-diphosphate-sugar epimerase